MQEIWRDVPGYEGLYQVSDRGRVQNAKRGRVLKPHINVNGYLQTTLSKNNKREYPLVHRLVAAAFISNPEGKPQINHKNGIKADNRAENLEWCTMSENLFHRHQILKQPGGRSKPVLCTDTGEVYPSAKAAASALGVSHKGIILICNNKQKTTGKNKLHFIYKKEKQGGKNNVI